MLQDIRHEKILNELDAKHSVKVTALAKALKISESTIRRDINELHRLGKLRKVYGGAVSLNSGVTSVTTNVSERKRINIEEKECIAQCAARMIEDDDFVYIDAGTTTEKMIEYIKNKNAIYVTNGIIHAKKLLDKGLNTYMIGGVLRSSTEAAIGTGAVDAVRNYNFTKCFMGANGVDINKGFSTPDVDEAAIKSAVIKQSYETYILADHTKFGCVSSVNFAALKEAYIITDHIDDFDYCQYTIIKEAEK